MGWGHRHQRDARRPSRAELADMFKRIEDALAMSDFELNDDWERGFFESVSKWFREDGWLSEKQLARLQEIAKRVTF